MLISDEEAATHLRVNYIGAKSPFIREKNEQRQYEVRFGTFSTGTPHSPYNVYK